MFICESNRSSCIIGVYVDVLLITGANQNLIKKIVSALESKYRLHKRNDLNEFLRIKVQTSEDGTLTLCQEKYIEEILAEFGMSECNSVDTSMKVGFDFSKFTIDKSLETKAGSVNPSVVCF